MKSECVIFHINDLKNHYFSSILVVCYYSGIVFSYLDNDASDLRIDIPSCSVLKGSENSIALLILTFAIPFLYLIFRGGRMPLGGILKLKFRSTGIGPGTPKIIFIIRSSQIISLSYGANAHT